MYLDKNKIQFMFFRPKFYPKKEEEEIRIKMFPTYKTLFDKHLYVRNKKFPRQKISFNHQTRMQGIPSRRDLAHQDYI